MRKIFISIITIAALISCSKDNTISIADGEAIYFGNAYVNNSTKAAEDPSIGTTNNPLTSFQVWGTINDTDNNPVSIFSNNTVEGNVGENSTWNCIDKIQYWIVGAKYNFAAVVNANSVETGTDLLPSKMVYEADGVTDLLYAKSSEYIGLESNNPKVAFSFNHMLSKVKFSVTNTISDTDYTYYVSDVKITNTYAEGKCDVSNQTWERVGSDTFTAIFGEVENVNRNTSGSDSECTYERLVIPGEFEANVEFVVDLYYKGKKINTTSYTGDNSKSVDVNFVAGYAYNFNISLGLTNPIQFTVTSNPSWTNAQEGPSLSL